MAWRNYKQSPGNKYHNKKVWLDGMLFDSRKEAYRWVELNLLEKAGKISKLERQKKFVLIPAQYEADTIGARGRKKKGKLIERECSYYADFYYWDEDKKQYVIEDTKGMRTPDYIIKRKLMLWNGYRITEV